MKYFDINWSQILLFKKYFKIKLSNDKKVKLTNLSI